jgi:hypothetical protein
MFSFAPAFGIYFIRRQSIPGAYPCPANEYPISPTTRYIRISCGRTAAYPIRDFLWIAGADRQIQMEG